MFNRKRETISKRKKRDLLREQKEKGNLEGIYGRFLSQRFESYIDGQTATTRNPGNFRLKDQRSILF